MKATTSSAVRASEIERAWAEHDPAGTRIPLEVWRRLRTIKSALGVTAVKIESALADPGARQLFRGGLLKRNPTGRGRALAKLRRAFAGAAVSDDEATIEVVWVAPSEPLIAKARTPGEKQDCLLLCLALAWTPTRSAVQFWRGIVLEVSDHAAARLLQRAPNANAHNCLHEAGAAFMAADAREIIKAAANRRAIFLPAGPGALVADVIPGHDGERLRVYARCKSWLTHTMLMPHQRFVAATPDVDRAMTTFLLHVANHKRS
jgi:hypothetical protein